MTLWMIQDAIQNIKMKKTIEVPDFEVHPRTYPNDVIQVYINKKDIRIDVVIDGAGNTFLIDREYLLNKLSHNDRKANK